MLTASVPKAITNCGIQKGNSPSSAANAVNVVLGGIREIKVNDVLDVIDI
jgi:hypothetical protein